MKDQYRFMGHIYDLLSNLYSGFQIPKCKAAMVDRIRSGDTVLFAGVGYGREAILAAEKGARVTVVDMSETMLEKFEKLASGCSFAHPVKKIHRDIMKVTPESGTYDFVFANFFLNVFPREQMDRVVRHLSSLANPGGHLVVGDFAYPSGGILKRTFQKIYWYIAVFPFFMMTRNAFHQIYNYPLYIKKSGLTVNDIRYFRLMGQNCYWSILSKKEG